MSMIADQIRQLWLPDLYKVTGRQEHGLLSLIGQENFQIYTQTTTTTAELHFDAWEPVVQSYACEVARMSTAAIETMDNLSESKALPQSTGWLIIRAYYAAFYAAHAIGRMLGDSLTNLDSLATNAIDAISDAYGMKSGSLERGLYLISADSGKKVLNLRKMVGDGSHETLWNQFMMKMRAASTYILAQPGNSSSAMKAAAKLTELENILTKSGAANGNWLSMIRNRVNYQHAYSAWFPYKGRPKYYEDLFERSTRWNEDSDSQILWSASGRDIQQFIECCALIVAISREMCSDMTRRCPKGKSFQTFSSQSLLRQLENA